jgi:hypothetical protein
MDVHFCTPGPIAVGDEPAHVEVVLLRHVREHAAALRHIARWGVRRVLGTAEQYDDVGEEWSRSR